MTRRLFTLARSNSGTATIELALIAPVLAIMVVGIADISIAYGRKLEIEQAAQRAIEKVMQTTGADTVEATIKTEAVCQINGAATPDPDNPDADPCASGRITTDNVTVNYSLKCSGAEKDYALDCDAGEIETRYITATVTDTYEPMFPVKFGTAADGKYHLSVTAGVRVQ